LSLPAHHRFTPPRLSGKMRLSPFPFYPRAR
jgi:hypothetical protein